ncbi:MAG: TonB-dependent receptor, partial [bacterium]
MATTTMSRGVFIFATVSVFLLLGAVAAIAQTGSVSGVVKSADTQEVLAGANVSILGTKLGAATGADGSYTISNVPAGTYRLQATFIGYDDRSTPITVTAGETATADFLLSESTIFGSEIVVTGSRRAEKLTDAPVSLSLVTAKELSKVPALTYAEALQKAKGVDTYRTGIDNVVLNARGFTTAYNYRFQILADGKKAHLPGAGLPAGRGYPVAREDIARMEAILGPSSALYGPNAHNGLLHIITKHPRDYPGTTLVAGGGENSILFGRVRHAQNFDKFAYKVNLAYFLGNDWVKNDTVGVDNTGKAYMENQDDDVKNFRTDASMYYLFSPEVEIVASAGYAKYNSITTSNIGRLQQVEQSYDFEQVRFNSPHFYAQIYRSGNDLGKTHSIENKVAALIGASNAGTPMTEDQAIDRVKFVDKGYRMNYEAQYHTTFYMGSSMLRFIAGIQHEDTRPNSEGTFLTEGRVNVDDPADSKLKLRQTGIYGQVETEFGERWKFVLAGRYDT